MILDSIMWFRKKKRIAKASSGHFLIRINAREIDVSMVKMEASVVQGDSHDLDMTISWVTERRSGKGKKTCDR